MLNTIFKFDTARYMPLNFRIKSITCAWFIIGDKYLKKVSYKYQKKINLKIIKSKYQN